MTSSDRQRLEVFLKDTGLTQAQFDDCYRFVVSTFKRTKRQSRKQLKPRRKLNKHEDEYRKYINSGEWRELREKALDFYGHECGRCGSKYLLHIHHKHYRNFMKERIEDLMILCESCHMEEHPQYKNHE